MSEHHDRPPRIEPAPHAGQLHQEDHRDERKRRSSIFWGLVLIALGVLFTVDQFDIFETTDLLHDWWPLVLIAFGIYSRGYVLTGIGVWLLIGELNLFGLSYSSSWPIILIVVGAGIILQALTGHSRYCNCGCRTEPTEDRP